MTADITTTTAEAFQRDEKGHNDDLGNEVGSIDDSEDPGPCICCGKVPVLHFPLISPLLLEAFFHIPIMF
jgi:hypothetical protein